MSHVLACGEFVKRQTKESGYSHFDGSWEELEIIVGKAMFDSKNVSPGYRDGVILIRVPSHKFYSSTVRITESLPLEVGWSPRKAGETSFVHVSVKAKKQSAKVVDIICYRSDVLEEDNDRTTDALWEIVAIKARVSEEEEPMSPYTMARNFLHLPGGTKGDFSAEEFAKSIVYWNSHAMCVSEKKSWWKKMKGWFK